MDVLSRIKAGERIMVTLPERGGCAKTYSLTDGTEVSRAQFDRMREFLAPRDTGLFDGAEPQSWGWGG